MHRFDIVVASYGQPELTRKCLKSIARKSGPSDDYFVTWIDNSPEPIGGAVGEVNAPIRCIWCPDNLGYTKSMNAGIALSTAPYVVLLNSDTEIQTENWLGKMWEHFVSEKPVAAVGPATNNKRQGQGRIPTTESFHPNVRMASNGLLDTRLSFFCVMLSREAIWDIGYLDDMLSPGYGEDDDWLMRAYFKGYSTVIDPGVMVHHVGQGSFSTDLKAELQARNVPYLQRKHQKALKEFVDAHPQEGVLQ